MTSHFLKFIVFEKKSKKQIIPNTRFSNFKRADFQRAKIDKFEN